MKYRIIEDEAGRFLSQFKAGLIGPWHLFARHADTSSTMLVIAMRDDDPARCASFATFSEAREFVERVKSKAANYWAEQEASERRKIEGVRPVRIIEL